ncbi:MAG: tyrosinase family protein [Deltaproteobacteria bacterium]|nr:tyrosinase family protein [Deltaproteobacteria bacterium]
MTIVRKDQVQLSAQEWTDFIDAINATHGVAAAAPSYRTFVRVHVDAMSPAGMSWGVHSMPWMGMDGRNFLAWHRLYLARLEARLRKVKPNVAVPYWDWIASPHLPPAISDPQLLQSWGVVRSWDPTFLPTQADVDSANARTTFPAFQRALEGVHAGPHNAVGGTMASSSSPADPIFWLHHASVDRLWAGWQVSNPGQDPPNLQERLLPPPILGLKVAKVIDIADLDYEYQ